MRDRKPNIDMMILSCRTREHNCQSKRKHTRTSYEQTKIYGSNIPEKLSLTDELAEHM